MNVLLVHNPQAGYLQYTRDDLVSALRDAGHDVTYRSTKDEAFEGSMEEPHELVVAAGGDGTVNRVALLLRGRGVPLVIFPLGTANNLARTFGYRGAISQLIEAWPSWVRHACDVGVARGAGGEERFVESFGIGVFTDRIAEERKRGKQEKKDRKQAGRAAAADHSHAEEKLRNDVKLLREHVLSGRARQIGVELDGNDWTGSYIMIEAMNIPLIGPRLAVAPGADPGDGELDVVFLAAENRQKFADHLEGMLSGATPGPGESGLAVRRAGRLKLVWDGSEAHVDGGLAKAATFAIKGGHGDEAAEAELSAERGAISFLAPAKA